MVKDGIFLGLNFSVAKASVRREYLTEKFYSQTLGIYKS